MSMLPERTPDWLRETIAQVLGGIIVAIFLAIVWAVAGRPVTRWLYSLPRDEQWLALGLLMGGCAVVLLVAIAWNRWRGRY